MKKIIFFILCIYTISASSQNYYQNLKKYWYYRQRLNKYFIKTGVNHGYSIPMSLRGKSEDLGSNKVLKWGQSSILLGEYIGVLATEYLLLEHHGYSDAAEQTRQELNLALNAVKRKDEATATWPPLAGCPNNGYDGFFLRDDVPANFNIDGLNDGLNYNTFDEIVTNQMYGTPNICNEVYSDYIANYNNPNSLGNLESQDEAIGLLLGMALVVRCLPPNSPEVVLAQEITDKIFTKWADNNFRLEPPCKDISFNTQKNLGMYSQFYEYGWSKAAHWITGNSYGFDGAWPLSKWQTIKSLTTGNSDNRRMEAILGVIGDSWWNPTIGGGPHNVTKEVTIYKTDDNDWEPYYLFLWKFLHNKSDYMPEYIEKAESQLNSAPACGPYFYIVNGTPYKVNGWASTGRYWNNKDKQTATASASAAWQGAFNGTDYMLMFNLYSLVTNSDYNNLLNLKILNKFYPYYVTKNVPIGDEMVFNPETHTMEHHYIWGTQNFFYYDFDHPDQEEGFETIETNMIVDTVAHSSDCNNPNTVNGHKGHVTLRAGKSIHLKPGFHAVKGSYFHAYIEPFTCSNNQIRNNNLSTCYDTLYSCEQQNNSIPIIYNDIDPVRETFPYEIMGIIKTKSSTDYDNFKILPNPNNGQFKIFSNTQEQKINIFIYNSIGILVYQSTVENFPVNINISNESKGLYLVKIQSTNNFTVLKSLKK